MQKTSSETEKKEISLLEQGTNLIAPFILGNTLAKKFIFLQLFTHPKEDEKFHIMLIGDTASGKSHICIDVDAMAPHSVLVSSKTTMAGLFGCATRRGIQGGEVYKARDGVVLIDELDKVSNDVISALLEPLQTGRSTITKYGQRHEIDVKANFLINANPDGGRWFGRPSFSQIPFSEPFLARFHVVVPFVGLSSKDYKKLGDIFDLREKLRGMDNERIDKIRKYISDRSGLISVQIGKDIVQKITEFVGELKEKCGVFVPNITPRQIEGVISLTKANARLNTRSYCTMKDFMEVRAMYEELFNVWLGR